VNLYGIANCDSVKKARVWLDLHGVAYAFVDLRRTPPSAALLARWIAQVGFEALVNRRGTTWRSLESQEQAAVRDARSAQALMAAHPTVIKRPVIEARDMLVVGFDAADYARRFATIDGQAD
jgi:Spx/MgsR family transcriptional regulator